MYLSFDTSNPFHISNPVQQYFSIASKHYTIQEIVFGKNSDIGEAVANLVEVENNRGKEKSSKKRRMEVKNAPETKLKHENAMRLSAKV